MRVAKPLLAALILVASLAVAANWPSFRGPDASGIADGLKLPDAFDATTGQNIAWKTAIPGLAHSSPVVWGDRIFVTTAISSLPDATFKPGLYGAGTASEDRSAHRWRVIALDKRSGKVLWEQTAYEGVPKEKRHIKATYANSTPATDGRYLVVFFGSQGLYTYDLNGKLLWKKDLGRFDVGAYDAPDYEWGTASSPILYKDMVIVQCDTSGEDFLMALDARTGRTLWRTPRDEMPSWATPTVVRGSGRDELVTNAPKAIRGYDPATGKELWRVSPSSDITAPTPVFDRNLIVVASGRRPIAPIYVLKSGAEGDLSLPANQMSGGHVVWSKRQRGSYMPTPLIYDGRLYVLGNQGVFDCYDLATGEEIYRERIPHGGSGFSASPVASDGRIYLPSEDGDVFVVKAGAKFEILGKNRIGEPLMATPALSDGAMYIRAEHHLFAISSASRGR